MIITVIALDENRRVCRSLFVGVHLRPFRCNMPSYLRYMKDHALPICHSHHNVKQFVFRCHVRCPFSTIIDAHLLNQFKCVIVIRPRIARYTSNIVSPQKRIQCSILSALQVSGDEIHFVNVIQVIKHVS